MSEAAALPSTGDLLGPPERLHPLYLLTGLGQSLKGAWGLIAGGAYFATQGRWWIVAVMAATFAFFSIGSLFLRWLNLEYRVGADELRIDSGFLSRTSRAIPFDRVTDVDLEQGPLHRLFGLAKVKLETGASAGGKEEEGVLHTISLARAEALADRAVGKDRRLHALGRDGDVGERQQAATAAEAGVGPVEAKAILAKQGADQACTDAKQDQQDGTADDRDDLVRQDQVAERLAAAQQVEPEAALKRVKT